MAVLKPDGAGNLVPHDRHGRKLPGNSFKGLRPPRPFFQPPAAPPPPPPPPPPDSVASGAPAAPEPDSASPAPAASGEYATVGGQLHAAEPGDIVKVGPLPELIDAPREEVALVGGQEESASPEPTPAPKPVVACAFKDCDKPRREKSIYCSQACASKASYYRLKAKKKG